MAPDGVLDPAVSGYGKNYTCASSFAVKQICVLSKYFERKRKTPKKQTKHKTTSKIIQTMVTHVCAAETCINIYRTHYMTHV